MLQGIFNAEKKPREAALTTRLDDLIRDYKTNGQDTLNVARMVGLLVQLKEHYPSAYMTYDARVNEMLKSGLYERGL